MDYEPWSTRFNMHFGYYRWGLNPFNREQMLDEMNAQVLDRLELPTKNKYQIIDLGCGVGTTARYAVREYANISVIGATIVPWQIEQAKSLSSASIYQERIQFGLIDYTNLPLVSSSLGGAIAIESSCYDRGKDKRQFLQEAFRVLEPGARLVVADGFTKGKQHTRLFNYFYREVCRGWVLEDFASIEDFTGAMEAIGYEDIQVQDASWRVALSVSFVPWVSVKYFFSQIFRKKGDRGIQLGHFIAPVYGLFMGLHRRQYGYHIVSGRKPVDSL